MKKFLYSFLGSMAAIWLSVLLGGLLLIFTFAAIFSSSAKQLTIEDHSILHIDLSGEIVDRDGPLSLLSLLQSGNLYQLSLSDILYAIDQATGDERIEGIYLECNGATVGMAQAQAIGEALEKFRKSGKFVWAYSDNFTQGNYLIATSADSIYLNPIGMVDIHGLQAQTTFYKGLLDKLGVEMQVVKVGTYKSAVEPFMLTGMSEANRQQQEHFLGRIWGCYTSTVAKARKTTVDSVNCWADSFAFTQPADWYTANNIVDKLLYRHQIEDRLAKKTAQEKDAKLVDVTTYAEERRALSQGGDKKKTIAILYAGGEITENGDEGIASDRMVPEIMDLIDNEDIDALILRVNSGGGSAFASEQIWEALEQFKKQTGKPFYVSMGDMAASGGYYISCGADRIFAQPTTLTGSIGIFGMIPNFQPLMQDKLGINTQTVSTNSGGAPTPFEPMTPGQRQAMQKYVDRGYELFTSRCAKGRHMSIDSIKAIAEGRVWDGQSALEIGLVDQLGSLQTTVNEMAKKLGVDAKDVAVQEYPELTTQWWRTLVEMSDDEVKTALRDRYFSVEQMGLRALRRLQGQNAIQARTNVVEIR